MSKQSGLGDNFYIDGYDLSGDTGSIQRAAGGPGALEQTGIDKGAFERIGGLRDGGMDWTSWFNPAAAQAHKRLSPLPTTDVTMMYCRGTALGSAAANQVAKQANYDGTRAQDGSLTFTVQSLSNNYGVQWGRLLTAGKRTDTGATNGSSVDFGVGSTAFGLQAFLHVFSFAGTDATIKIQSSSDDGGGDAFADVTAGGFTAVTAGPTVQRIATAAGATIERYLRVVTTTSAGFTSLVFAVAVIRNDTATVF